MAVRRELQRRVEEQHITPKETVFQYANGVNTGFKLSPEQLLALRGKKFLHLRDGSTIRENKWGGRKGVYGEIEAITPEVFRRLYENDKTGRLQGGIEKMHSVGVQITDIFHTGGAVIVHALTPVERGRQKHYLYATQSARLDAGRLARFIRKVTGNEVEMVKN